MFRFDELIRGDMIVRDVKQSYPESIAVFEALGFRQICDDCTIRVVAQRQGLADWEVLAALNQAIGKSKGTTHDPHS